MRYTLIWHPSAQDDLLSLWLEGPDRRAISEAADSVDGTLRIDPVLRGETLTGPLRVVIIEPLEFVYRVIEDDRIVQIVALRRAVEIDDSF
jgi:hypothetical protein